MHAAYGLRLSSRSRRERGSEKDLGRRGGSAAEAKEADAHVQVGFARGETLCDRKWIAALDQYVETPAFHLRLLPFAGVFDWCLGGLGHRVGRFVLPSTNPSDACWPRRRTFTSWPASRPPSR